MQFFNFGFKRWRHKYSSITLANQNVSFSYLVKHSGQGGSSETLPMLIALHGDGDTVGGFYESLLRDLQVKARIILIKAPIVHECGNVWPFSADQYVEYGGVFSEAVDALTIKYPTVNKPVLLGFSGGGAMAYYQAIKYGDCFSYIFPVSGLMTKEQLGDGLIKPSANVCAYHGKSDEVVSFSAGKVAVKLLKKKGINVSFTEFESGHQGIFTDMKVAITQAIESKLQSLH